ncbi:MAG: zinc ribbon domain-containing protein [Erysipelotrichaceae bacterium]
MQCLNCKKEIDDNDNYCGYCGINLSDFKKYLDKVGNKTKRMQDKDYFHKIKTYENNILTLEKRRAKAIKKIEEARWVNIGNRFAYNMTEGIVKFNQSVVPFSSIKSVKINCQNASRTEIIETGTSKKHISLGGGVVGADILRPLGAVIGGAALGKTTTKAKSTVNSVSTCTHLGVLIDINNDASKEIVLLLSTVDTSDIKYRDAYSTAYQIAEKLRYLSSLPVPTQFLKVEEEESVKKYDIQIKEEIEKIEKVKNGSEFDNTTNNK